MRKTSLPPVRVLKMRKTPPKRITEEQYAAAAKVLADKRLHPRDERGRFITRRRKREVKNEILGPFSVLKPKKIPTPIRDFWDEMCKKS